MKKPVLSIVVVSYNTREILRDCLKSLESVKDEVRFEVIVSDNASGDKSQEMVKKSFPWVRLLEHSENLGFSKANNAARKYCKGKYVLFLNSDTVVHKNTLRQTVKYLDEHDDVGSVTCKIVLPSGALDKDSRRSFPTPWVSLTHLVIPLDRLFPNSPLFAQYWYSYISEDKEHEVDIIQGAYHLTRKSILDKVGWFDEDYFLDGEDIDLCWQIKQLGYKIMYFPKVSITHIKKASKKRPTKENRKKFIAAGVGAMEIFYRKRMWDKYPKLLNYLVIAGVRLIKYLRLMKATLS